MQITWTNCEDEMPPDDHLICKDADGDSHITHGLLVKEYYDDYVVSNMQWTPFTQEKWECLNE